MFLVLGLLLIGGSLYAASGDLIVNGKVGIGTTNPAEILHLSAPTSNRSMLKFSDSATNAFVGLKGSNLSFGTYSAEDMMVLTASGNVGIGTTSPTAKLHVVQPENAVWAARIVSSAASGNSALLWGYAASTSADSALLDISSGGGAQLMMKGNGYVGIGTTSPAYTLDVAGYIRGTNVNPSDLHLKDSIFPVEAALDKVLSMQGVSYTWKREEYKARNFPAGRHYGVIAQEMEKVLPEAVSTSPDGEKSVAYTEIIPVLIEAIKEQQKEIEQLKKALNLK